MNIIKNFYSSKIGLLPTVVIFSTLLVIATLLSVTFFFWKCIAKSFRRSNRYTSFKYFKINFIYASNH